MTILLPTLVVAFAAFCVWLTVRIINRKERWAKWTLVGTIVGVPILYIGSFGPACWATSNANPDVDVNQTNRALAIYWPLAKALSSAPNSRFGEWLIWWMMIGTPKDYWIILPVDVNRTRFIRLQSP